MAVPGGVGGLGAVLGQNHRATFLRRESIPYAIERYQVETQHIQRPE